MGEIGDTSKRLAKDLTRAALRPLLRRIAVLREQIAVLDARLANVEQQQTATHQTVDEFLDAISQQNAVARETRREQQKNQHATWDAQSQAAEGLARVEARMEFIRKEVMLEIQSGSLQARRGPGSRASDPRSGEA